jgi:hypothetical protein
MYARAIHASEQLSIKGRKLVKPLMEGLKPKVNDFTYFIKDLSLKRNASVSINWK